MIAALFVEEGGAYCGIPDVDPWPESRDARLYAGPWPAVAHPPCERWGRFARAKGQARGDDGGCFAAAITAVERFGGVLEHPAASWAWTAFGLDQPGPRGWRPTRRGFTCRVEQGNYGHRARKPTWLYVVGFAPPDLRWGPSEVAPIPERSVASALARGVRPSKVGTVALLSRAQRRATPIAFRDLLLSMARSVDQEQAA